MSLPLRGPPVLGPMVGIIAASARPVNGIAHRAIKIVSLVSFAQVTLEFAFVHLDFDLVVPSSLGEVVFLMVMRDVVEDGLALAWGYQ